MQKMVEHNLERLICIDDKLNVIGYLDIWTLLEVFVNWCRKKVLLLVDKNYLIKNYSFDERTSNLVSS